MGSVEIAHESRAMDRRSSTGSRNEHEPKDPNTRSWVAAKWAVSIAVATPLDALFPENKCRRVPIVEQPSGGFVGHSQRQKCRGEEDVEESEHRPARRIGRVRQGVGSGDRMVQPRRCLEWNDGVETGAHEAHDRPRARERFGGDASRPDFCSSANGARGVDEQLELAIEWKLDKNFERRGPLPDASS